MGKRRSRQSRKFYEEQIEELHSLFVRYVNQSPKVTKEVYYNLCDELGQEPDTNKMPLDVSDFPDYVQVAFFIYSLLTDRYDTMNGVWQGKDWSIINIVFDLYEIEDKKTTFLLMKMYESCKMDKEIKAQVEKQKADKRKAEQGSGKTYTHKVTG